MCEFTSPNLKLLKDPNLTLYYYQGHGTLHAIYASIEESCRVKGWDGVDLLIIGGDFQVSCLNLDTRLIG